MQVDHDGFTVDEAGRGMKNPGGIESAGAYKAKSAVRLVSPPVELPDQRGGDRLDERVHVFGAYLHTM